MVKLIFSFKKCILTFSFLIISISCFYGQPKLISVPQHGPDTRLLKNNYIYWERNLPFAGLSISFNDNILNTNSSIGFYGKTGNELCFSVFDRNKTIIYNNYTNAIADLATVPFVKFKNNFMMIALFGVNWTKWDDDATWKHQLSNLEVAAKIAHDSKLKGIILDTEPYGSPQNLDLSFYCQQFVEKVLIQDGKIAYVALNKRVDSNTLEDMFPKKNDVIYWKSANYIAGNLKLTKVNLDIYKDDKGNYYYPLLDPKFKTEIALLVNKVKQRGAQIIEAIRKNFKNAEIMLTVGPSYVKTDLDNINGLKPNNNPLHTQYGLIIPLTAGMLQSIKSTSIKLIDGQEQTYYLKTQKEFTQAHANFNSTAKYYDSSINKIYSQYMGEAFGLYLKPVSVANRNSKRLFTRTEAATSIKLASSIKTVKYVWIYEEEQSYWFIEALSKQYIDKSKVFSKLPTLK